MEVLKWHKVIRVAKKGSDGCLSGIDPYDKDSKDGI